MKLTVKDLRAIVGYLEVAKATTERGIKESAEGSCYHDIMVHQLEGITALIDKIDGLEI